MPLVQDGQLGGTPSLSGEGALAGKMGGAYGEGATSLDEASVSVAGGEGLMGGVEVSADLEVVWDIGKEMVNGAIDDAKQLQLHQSSLSKATKVLAICKLRGDIAQVIRRLSD